MDINELEKKAKFIRRTIVDIIYKAKSSHIGCSLSAVDILVALYFDVMEIDPDNPQKDGRDRFILSKGHGVSALYSTLAERGFFDKAKLDEYGTDGTVLASHVVLGSVPGTETSNGSGGHGLPIGVGMAIVDRHKDNNARNYVLSGDGELEEGSVWEAAMFAAVQKLDNITLIVDRNGFQDGKDKNSTEDIMGLEPLDKKFESFGWEVDMVDGHDLGELILALNKRSSKPRVVIAKTIKGKGVSYMEGDPKWHGSSPNEEEYKLAIKELA